VTDDKHDEHDDLEKVTATLLRSLLGVGPEVDVRAEVSERHPKHLMRAYRHIDPRVAHASQ
jgi:hypothetical protein